jgi:D-glycero-D-manno-heptose 1,7-bisphosphate phosphatase
MTTTNGKLHVSKGFHAARPPSRGAGGRKTVFLDRDGTLIHDKPGFYLHHPDQIRFYRGVIQGLRRLAAAGFELVVVSNQSGIARGFLDEPMLRRIHTELLRRLRRHGIELTGIYYCPHHPDEKCSCRKPQTTLADRAVRRHGLTLEGSFMIGDKRADVDLGKALGIPTALLRTGHGNKQLVSHGKKLKPDKIARDFLDAARWVLKESRG